MINEKCSKTIGLDLDGVLADLAPEFLKYIKKEYALDFQIDDIKSHDATEWSGLNQEQIRHIFSNTDIFNTVKPVFFSTDATKKLREAGWKIHVITFRPWHDNLGLQTERWLESNGYNYDTVHLSEDHDKTQYVHKLGINVFVEDRKESAELMSNVCDVVYLLDYPYNQGSIRDKINRVKNWEEIINSLETLF